MKLSILLVIITAMQVHATALAQRITLTEKNAKLDKIFRAINKQSKIDFIYKIEQLEKSKPVTLQVYERPIEEVLELMFKNQPIDYVVKNQTIIIRDKKAIPTDVDKLVLFPMEKQSLTIQGRVTDKNSQPLSDVTILEKGTTNGVKSGSDGRFMLTVKDRSAILRFTILGYLSQELPASANFTQVILAEDLAKLDEVVVVGYGTQRKSSMTAAVTTVNTEDLQNIPRPNVYSALQGRVAGLTINETSGEPDASPSLLVRGIGTIDGNTGPLILIDGTPTGTLNEIPAQDIESISVLKDAAAAAIYGARAANGVILVTTKQGKSQETKPIVQLNSYVGLQTLAQFPKKLSAYEYATLVDEVHVNDGKSPVYSEKDLEMYQNGLTDDFHGNTDWKKESLLNTAPIYTNHLSVSGNGKMGRYYVAGEYVDQKGMVKEIDHYNRMNFRANITSDISKKIQFQFLSNYIRTAKDATGLAGVFSNVLAASPTARVKYSDGNWGSMIFANDRYLWDTGNPVKSIEEYGPKKTYWNTLNTSANISYTPIEGLVIKGMGTYRNSWGDKQDYNRSWMSWDPLKQEIAQTGPASLLEEWTKEYKYDLQLTATYEKTLDDHFFKALAGYSQESLRSDFIKGFRKVFINNEIYELNGGDASTQTNEGGADQWSFASLFGRLNYTYKDKYLLEANLRYDGSSRFAPGQQWGVFPSISVGWNINKESFLSAYDFIDNLKLRLSAGQLGNAEKVALYLWFPKIESGPYYNFDGKLVFGTRPGEFANRDLTWETTTSYNAGLDGNFFKGKLNVELDLWRKNTNDILLVVPISTTIGSPSSNLTVNAGKVGSQGFDLTVGTQGNFANNFRYAASLSFTGWHSWIIDLKDRATAFSTEFRPGEDLGNYYGYQSLGIINDEETLDRYKKLENVAPQTALGDLQYKDQNGDGKLDYLDNVKIGNWYTKNNFGLNLSLGYKGFDAQIFFQGAFNVDKQIIGNTRTSFINFQSPDANQLDRWTEENRNADALYPRLRKEYNMNTGPNSSFWIKDASYVKLKNLQIGYNFSKEGIERLGLKGLRVFLTGTNLFTIAPHYLKGYDPEVDMGPSIYPTLRVYAAGVNVSF
ncbi:TonB-dependent receptor [Olivibacter ginsenosidimutans]|uniref:TonB-dependent receptor n=2 Tax=Olivibacter ginsenosidimutans TaxID=1176537 RepID=A0ABP9CAA9_9SPHI